VGEGVSKFQSCDKQLQISDGLRVLKIFYVAPEFCENGDFNCRVFGKKFFDKTEKFFQQA